MAGDDAGSGRGGSSFWARMMPGGGRDRRGSRHTELAFTQLDAADGDDELEEDALLPSSTGGPPRVPEDEANFFSRLFFLYVGPLIAKGSKKTLDMEDLWGVSAWDQVDELAAAYDAERDGMAEDLGKAPVWRVLCTIHYKRFLLAGALKLVVSPSLYHSIAHSSRA